MREQVPRAILAKSAVTSVVIFRHSCIGSKIIADLDLWAPVCGDIVDRDVHTSSFTRLSYFVRAQHDHRILDLSTSKLLCFVYSAAAGVLVHF